MGVAREKNGTNGLPWSQQREIEHEPLIGTPPFFATITLAPVHINERTDWHRITCSAHPVNNDNGTFDELFFREITACVEITVKENINILRGLY